MLSPTAGFAADRLSNEGDPGTAQIDQRRYGDFRDRLADWKVTVGAAGIYLPEYEGSDKFEVKPFPVFSAQFGDRVHVDTRGVRFDVLQLEGVKAGLTGGYELGRKEEDSDYLHGMGDIDAGGVVGGVLGYEIGPFEAYGKINKTIGGSDGLTATVGAKASYRYERLVFSADVSGTWADKKHMEAYFGVSDRQSARSGLASYEAGAGVKRVDLQGSVTYMLTDNWLVTGSAGTGILVGDARDSPVVKDEIQPFALLGLAYKF